MFAVYFVLVELAIYLLYKILRKDFFYWVKVSGVLSALISLVARICAKGERLTKSEAIDEERKKKKKKRCSEAKRCSNILIEIF